LDGFPIALEVALTQLQVNLQELGLQDALGQGQGGSVGEVAGLVFYDTIQLNSLDYFFEFDVWLDGQAAFCDGVSAQKSCGNVLTRELASVSGRNRSGRCHCLYWGLVE
jgi:hypothetical protein